MVVHFAWKEKRPTVGLSTEPHAVVNHFAGWPAKGTQKIGDKGR